MKNKYYTLNELYENYYKKSELFVNEINNISIIFYGTKFGRRINHLINYYIKNYLFSNTISESMLFKYDYILEKLNTYYKRIDDKEIKNNSLYLYKLLYLIRKIVELILVSNETFESEQKLIKKIKELNNKFKKDGE